MRAPSELTALAHLRSRGQAPDLAVLITDHWAWAQRFQADIGSLCIRVRSADDHGHDWSPLAGLWVILGLRKPTPAQLSDFATAVLRANPSRLESMSMNERYITAIWPVRREA